jgi:hypothetical protein
MATKSRKLSIQQRQKYSAKADELCLDLGRVTAAYFGGGEASLELNMTDITDLVYEINRIMRRLRESE